MMLPQMLMMGLVNYFFSGFVLGKIPFPLTPSFKGMLQRGINLTTLDTAYVTSMSWYFLVMFGMRGLYSIVLGANNQTDDTQLMQQQMGMEAHSPASNRTWARSLLRRRRTCSSSSTLGSSMARRNAS